MTLAERKEGGRHGLNREETGGEGGENRERERERARDRDRGKKSRMGCVRTSRQLWQLASLMRMFDTEPFQLCSYAGEEGTAGRLHEHANR